MPVAAFDVPMGEEDRTPLSGHPRTDRFAGIAADVLAPHPAESLSSAEFLAELAEGGIGYAPELSGTESAFRLRDGRLVLGVGTPELQRDHVKPRVTLAPHVLAAIAQGLQAEAKRQGSPDWARTAPHHIDEIRLLTDGSGGVVPVAYVVFDVTADGEGLGGSVGLLGRNGQVVGVLCDLWCGDDEGPRKDPDVSERVIDGAEAADRGTPAESSDGVISFAVDELREMAGGILKFERGELDARTGFDAFGFDSISLVTLSKQIRERFGIDLTPAVFFDRNTFDSLGRHLFTEHEGPLRAAYERSLPPDPAGEPAPSPGSRTRGETTGAADETTGAAGETTGAPDVVPSRPAAPRSRRTRRCRWPSSAPRASSPARPIWTRTGRTWPRGPTASRPSPSTGTTRPTRESRRRPSFRTMRPSSTTWTRSTPPSSASCRARPS